MKRNNRAGSVLAVSGGLIVFYLIYEIKILLIIALCLIAAGLFSAYLSSGIYWLWTGFAKILAFLNSCLLLGIIFYLMLTPIALIRKLSKKKNR